MYTNESSEWRPGSRSEIRGTLRFADSIKDVKAGAIKLLSHDGVPIRIIVPQGMDDIVGPLWSHEVVAVVMYRGGKYYLEDIRKFE